MCVSFMNQNRMIGLEGDRAERSEVQTSQRDVCRESVEETQGAAHAASSVAVRNGSAITVIRSIKTDV